MPTYIACAIKYSLKKAFWYIILSLIHTHTIVYPIYTYIPISHTYLYSLKTKLFVALTVVFMDNVWMMPVSVHQAGKAPDVIWRHVVNVVKANVSTAVVFVIMASMANIVALMLVGLIAILMEFVKICLKRINDRNMSKFFAAESNVKKKK